MPSSTEPTVSRRSVLAGLAAGTAMPAPLLAAGVERRRIFDIYRGNSLIGEHRVTVRPQGVGIAARTDIDIAVKVLGITAYRYTLGYSEEYDDENRLLRLDAQANDNGEAGYVRARRAGGLLEVDGSAYSGNAPIDAAPTSYWRPASLQSSPWISTQSGLLLPVNVSQTSAPQTPPNSSAYIARDGRKFEVTLFYDARREWVGSAFEARGEIATYRLREETGALNA